MKPVKGLRGMRSMRRPSLTPLRTVEPTIPASPAERIEELYDSWVERVGESRAMDARRMFERRPPHLQARNRASLPNLLAEAWAEMTGYRYVIELDMGFAQPDLVVFLPEGPVVIRVQGDYWHSRPDAVAKDAAQREVLEGNTIEGQRIVRIVDVWEREIYESNGALDRALSGVSDG